MSEPPATAGGPTGAADVDQLLAEAREAVRDLDQRPLAEHAERFAQANRLLQAALADTGPNAAPVLPFPPVGRAATGETTAAPPPGPAAVPSRPGPADSAPAESQPAEGQPAESQPDGG